MVLRFPAQGVSQCIRAEIIREVGRGRGRSKLYMATINAIATTAMSARAKTATATSGATPLRSIQGPLIWFLHSLDAKCNRRGYPTKTAVRAATSPSCSPNGGRGDDLAISEHLGATSGPGGRDHLVAHVRSILERLRLSQRTLSALSLVKKYSSFRSMKGGRNTPAADTLQSPKGSRQGPSKGGSACMRQCRARINHCPRRHDHVSPAA
jgi:hypothetical protein